MKKAITSQLYVNCVTQTYNYVADQSEQRKGWCRNYNNIIKNYIMEQ